MEKLIERKLLHLLFGIFLLLALVYKIIDVKFLFYFLIFSCFLSLISLKFEIPLISWFLKNFGKKDEKIPGRGFLFSIIGSLLALRLFSFDIALASIAILTFSDSSSYIIGFFLGQTKSKLNNQKNIEGIIGGMLIGTLASLFFVSFIEAFLASLGAMLVELVEIKISEENIDDNLLIPLVAGAVIFLLRRWA